MAHETKYEWLHAPGRELSLLADARVLLCYHFLPDREKPYFHPLCTPKGTPLTCFEAWDHIWHRGLWFSWVFIDGLDYWEEFTDGRRAGRTDLAAPEQIELGPHGATVATRLSYRPTDGQPVLEERRRITIGLPRADGSYAVDWHQTFTALRDQVVIDRIAITAEKPWGGYGGLSWRAARSLGNFHSVDSEGRRDKEIEHQRARWVGMNASADGGRGIQAGLAMFDHPTNPRAPSYWRCVGDPGFGYFSPSFTMADAWTLPRAKPLVLRYRVLVHDGPASAETIEAEYRRFSAET